MILAGDVGGTKTHLALFRPGDHPRSPALEHKFPSGEHASLESLVLEFLNTVSERPTRAVLGIAGPVVNNRTEATNLPWVIDGSSMSVALGGAQVTLINDLEATAWGIPLLEASELEVLQSGSPAPGNRALIAAGTRLGEALLIWDGERHLPSASEGGAPDFGPPGPLA